jgi:hypothetical protein
MRKLSIFLVTLILVFSLGSLVLAVTNDVTVNLTVGEKTIAEVDGAINLNISWDDAGNVTGTTEDSVTITLSTNTNVYLSQVSSTGFAADINNDFTYEFFDPNDNSLGTINPGGTSTDIQYDFAFLEGQQYTFKVKGSLNDGVNLQDLPAGTDLSDTITLTYTAGQIQ